MKRVLGVEAEGFWDFPWHILDEGVVEQLPEPGRSRVLFTIEMQKSTEEALRVMKSRLPTGEKLRRVGEAMTYQHKLLSTLYEVSLPQLDQLVEKAVEAGAYGAKLSGAGLGGVVIALAPDRETAVKIGRSSEAARWWVVEVDRGLEYGN